MEEIILYTTHCPMCKMVEKQLTDKKIEYKVIDDTQVMLSKGFHSAPILEVNGVAKNAKEALNWIRGK